MMLVAPQTPPKATSLTVLPPPLVLSLISELIAAGCEVRGDESAREADRRVKPATEADWSTEYLDAVIAAHDTLWHARNRPGGFVDSVAHLTRLRDAYETGEV